jgi:hypothetical protein
MTICKHCGKEITGHKYDVDELSPNDEDKLCIDCFLLMMTNIEKAIDIYGKKSLKTVKILNNKIELFEGRPQRELIINNDDLINFKIVLETSTSLEDLITKI